MNTYNYFEDNWLRNMTNNNSLFTPEEGFLKGNLFSSLYSQYKNYQPMTLKATNEREKFFLELSWVAFAAHELNLYLDVHPNDTSMITLFNDYRKKEMDLSRKYEEKYGALTVMSENSNDNQFSWEEENWPWERDMNV